MSKKWKLDSDDCQDGFSFCCYLFVMLTEFIAMLVNFLNSTFKIDSSCLWVISNLLIGVIILTVFSWFYRSPRQTWSVLDYFSKFLLNLYKVKCYSLQLNSFVTIKHHLPIFAMDRPTSDHRFVKFYVLLTYMVSNLCLWTTGKLFFFFYI